MQPALHLIEAYPDRRLHAAAGRRQVEARVMPSTTGMFPNSDPKPKSSGCDECKRLLGIFEQMRALPLPQRVSYVYMGLINEALEGK
jgi:hypothetical protein